MYNWSVDLSRLKKNKREYEIFKLEQSINYGLNGKKLSEKSLRKYWNDLQIDVDKREYLELLLWPEKKS